MPEPKTVRLVSIPLAKFKARSGSHVLSFFTEERGQIRAGLRGGGKKKPGAPVLPLFSTYEILFREPTHAEGLYEVAERETLTSRPLLNSGSPIEAWAAASVISELLLRTTENEDPHPYLFRMFDKGLDQLEAGQKPSVLLAAFLVKFLEHVGYRPRWETGSIGAPARGLFFIPSLGGLCTEAERIESGRGEAAPLGASGAVTSEEIAEVFRFRTARFEELEDSDRVEVIGKKWVRLLGYYVEYHLETRLKSLAFWADLHSGPNR